MIVHTGVGGWQLVWLSADDSEPLIRVRFAEEEDGRLELAEVHLVGSPRLTADTLRKIPWNQVEAIANGPDRDELRCRIAESGTRVAKATHRWLTTIGGGESEPKVYIGPGRRSLRVQIPAEGHKKPDSFYRRVAELYETLTAAGSHRPAREIADANPGVEITTIHRWIREARARRLLGSGRQGKAG